MSRTISLPKHSPMRRTVLFQRVDANGALISDYEWGTWEPIDFPQDASDAAHTVRAHELGRLDNLAFRFYGDPYLWWVLAHVNNIRDPLFGMTVGMRLRVPSRDVVLGVLQQEDVRGAVSRPQQTFGLPLGTANNANTLGNQ